MLLSGVVRAGPIDPQNPPHRRFADDWAEIFMAGAKVGYAHSTMARDGDMIHTGMDMKVRVGRAGQTVSLSILQTTTETLAGKPAHFQSTMDMSVMKTTTKGTVSDGKVTIVSSQYGMDKTQTFDFPAGALMTWGAFRESLLRGFKPGTQYTLKMYAPELRMDDAVSAKTLVGEWESFEHRGRFSRGQKVIVALESPLGSIEMTSWVDQHGQPLKAKIPMPGLGDMELITTDQPAAVADFVPPEIFMTTVIKAKRKINPESTRRITYRIRAIDPAAELGSLPTTGMQTPKEQSDRSVELVVTRQSHVPRADGAGDTVRDPGAEYLGGNLMMNTDDPKLVELAKQASGGEKAPFALADKLRRFVTDYVQMKSMNIGFATASEVARTKEGDCSEHGVLLAALGRLNGLPSRVVAGLAYVPSFGGQDDIFGYHMWTQFFIDGRWIDVDAALEETQCSPCRIALASSSLRDCGLADLSLPLISRIGGIDIDILEVSESAPKAPADSR